MRPSVRSSIADISGSLADLGILIPIAAALVLENGLDPATLLVCAGALYLASGLYFKVPVPVQPIKAAAAIAIASGMAPAEIAAAGVVLGAVLVLIGMTGAATVLSRIFAKPIVRGLQLGVGLILMRTALGLPDEGATSVYVVGIVVALFLLAASSRSNRWPAALVVVAAGVLYTLFVSGRAPSPSLTLWRPSFLAGAFEPSVLWASFVVLVIPQIPLTLGNAVVALIDLEHEYFGSRSGRVNPAAVSLSCGLANIVTGSLGGMPMCHGSSGLTAHYRAGARTITMNIFIGGVLLVLGLLFGTAALDTLDLIPVAVLMGMLMFTGVTHSWLATDLRGYDLVLAVVIGTLGLVTSNLSIALAVGLLMFWPVHLRRRARQGMRVG